MAPTAIDAYSAPAVGANKAGSKQGDVASRVDSWDAATVTVAELKDSFARNGVLYIRNLVSKEDIAQINKEIKPHLEDDKAWEGACFPPQTVRISGLVVKSEAFRKKVVMNKLWNDITDEILTLNHPSWFGNIQAEGVSKPVLSGSILFRISPGAAAQGLHRDAMIHHHDNPQCTEEEFDFKRETAIHMFLAGSKTTKENGATRFVPKSHLQKTSDGPQDEADAIYAEMEPGDAMILLTSVMHAGSANTSADEDRLVYCDFRCRGTLRTFENQYLTIPPEVGAQWTDEELATCGYAVSHPFLGGVNFNDPMVAIRGQKEGKRYDITDGKVLSRPEQVATQPEAVV